MIPWSPRIPGGATPSDVNLGFWSIPRHTIDPPNQKTNCLAGWWFGTAINLAFSHMNIGLLSSSQLTKSYFSGRGGPGPPTSTRYWSYVHQVGVHELENHRVFDPIPLMHWSWMFQRSHLLPQHSYGGCLSYRATPSSLDGLFHGKSHLKWMKTRGTPRPWKPPYHGVKLPKHSNINVMWKSWSGFLSDKTTHRIWIDRQIAWAPKSSLSSL